MDEMLNPFVAAVVYFCEMLIAYVFLSNVAERRKNPANCLLIGTLLFSISSVANLLSLNSILVNALIVPLVHFLFGIRCFRINIYRGIFYSAVLCSLCAALEFVVIYIVSALLGDSLTAYNYNPLILVLEFSISKTLYLIASLLLSKAMRYPQCTGSLPISIFLYPIITLICLLILFYFCVTANISTEYHYLFSAVSVLMFAATVLLGFTYQRQLEKDNEYMRITHELNRLQLEKSYYDILTQQNHELMIYAHDAKNHLAAIQALNKDPDISGYVSKLSERLDRYTCNCHSGNKILDVIINRYVIECEQAQISFDYDVKLYNLDDIEEVDLVSILGNLMDNAIEAAKKTDKKKIFLETTRRNMYHVLLIKNSSPSPSKSDGRLITSKEDSSMHGFGLKSVARTLKKYQGDLQWDYDEENCMFTMTVMIGIPVVTHS